MEKLGYKKMEKTYAISESRLIELLESEARLIALENGGVDNWSYYDEALKDFFNEPDVENYPQVYNTDLIF